MSVFTQTLVDHLAKELSIKDSDIYDALDSFCGIETGKTKKEKEVSVKKAKGAPTITKTKIPENKKKELRPPKISGKNNAGDKHTCQRIKRGQTEACGEPATRSLVIKGKTTWLCGAEKSKCYFAEQKNLTNSSMNEKQNKVSDKKKGAATATASAGKKITKEPPKKASSILENVLKEKKINTISVQTKKHGKVDIEKNKRLLIDRDTREFYGVLDEDNETIHELTKKDITWIESTGHTIRQKVSKPKEFKGRDKITEDTNKKVTKKTKKSSSSSNNDSTSSSNEEGSSSSEKHSELSDEDNDSKSSNESSSADSTTEELVD
jgi:hypothetical protein